MKTFFWGFLVMITASGCSVTRSKCAKFYSYKSNKIDIKAISSTLKKAGSDIGVFSIGEISIDPKNVVASDELQKLDMLQFTACDQIRRLPKNDTSRVTLLRQQFNTLNAMLRIANNPDSLLLQKVSRLETAESERANNERAHATLKVTPPQFDVNLHLIPDKGIFVSRFILINDVPIKVYPTSVHRMDGKRQYTSVLRTGYTTLYPTQKREYVFFEDSLNNKNISEEDIFKVQYSFRYESIYFDEMLLPNLQGLFKKEYLVNRTTKSIQEIK